MLDDKWSQKAHFFKKSTDQKTFKKLQQHNSALKSLNTSWSWKNISASTEFISYLAVSWHTDQPRLSSVLDSISSLHLFGFVPHDSVEPGSFAQASVSVASLGPRSLRGHRRLMTNFYQKKKYKETTDSYSQCENSERTPPAVTSGYDTACFFYEDTNKAERIKQRDRGNSGNARSTRVFWFSWSTDLAFELDTCRLKVTPVATGNKFDWLWWKNDTVYCMCVLEQWCYVSFTVPMQKPMQYYSTQHTALYTAAKFCGQPVKYSIRSKNHFKVIHNLSILRLSFFFKRPFRRIWVKYRNRIQKI